MPADHANESVLGDRTGGPARVDRSVEPLQRADVVHVVRVGAAPTSSSIRSFTAGAGWAGSLGSSSRSRSISSFVNLPLRGSGGSGGSPRVGISGERAVSPWRASVDSTSPRAAPAPLLSPRGAKDVVIDRNGGAHASDANASEPVVPWRRMVGWWMTVRRTIRRDAGDRTHRHFRSSLPRTAMSVSITRPTRANGVRRATSRVRRTARALMALRPRPGTGTVPQLDEDIFAEADEERRAMAHAWGCRTPESGWPSRLCHDQRHTSAADRRGPRRSACLEVAHRQGLSGAWACPPTLDAVVEHVGRGPAPMCSRPAACRTEPSRRGFSPAIRLHRHRTCHEGEQRPRARPHPR